MDLKLSGKSWAGKIYHQFEAICQDFDDFVSKDTVKYVEDQAQSVGVSVKRFYSDVVKDILPPSGDNVKPKARSLAGEQYEMRDHVNSATGIRAKPTCVNEKQLSVEQGSIDTLRNSKASWPIELDHEMQFARPPCADPFQEAKTCLQLTEDGDGIVWNDADSDIEENITGDLIPVPPKSSSNDEVFSVTSDKDHKNSVLQDDVRDHVNSATGIRAKHTCVDEKQLSVEQGYIDTLRNSKASLPIELDHKIPFTKPLCSDPFQEAKTCLQLKEDGDSTIWNDADNGVEENITRDLIPVTPNSSSNDEVFSVTSDKDHKNSMLTMASSPALSAHEAGMLAIMEERISCNSFSDNAECLPSITSTGWSFEGKLPMVEDPNSNENISLSAPPAASTDKVHEDNRMLMDSLLSSAYDAAHRDLGKDGTLCHTSSTKDECFDVSSTVQSPKLVFSYCSCDEEEEIGVISSSSTSPKSSNILESTSVDCIQKAENICNSHAESSGCACNIFTQSSAPASYETKAMDMLPAFSILESNGSSVLTPTLAENNSSPTDGSVYVVGSSKSRHEQHYKDGQSEFAISPSETGNTHEIGFGISYLNMETVDLSPDSKHDGRSVVFNGNYVHAASHRRRNFGYYKKLIQDAFVSRKRLSKEYEHLAILYGDIDMESSQHFEPSSLPSSPTLSVHAARTRLSQETCETEWELL